MRFELELDDVLYFTDRALDGMLAIVEGLGDDLANTAPDLRGANSPVAILAHCLGVVEFWAGAVIGGRTVERDREAEFTAQAKIAELATRVEESKARIRVDLSEMDSMGEPRVHPPGRFQGPDRPLTQGAALIHVVEELSQHHGHMEISRDLLLAR